MANLLKTLDFFLLPLFYLIYSFLSRPVKEKKGKIPYKNFHNNKDESGLTFFVLFLFSVLTR